MSRRLLYPAFALALVCAVAGCASIPTSGPVYRSDVVVEEPGQSYLRAPGPRKDASPVQIVIGFLNAQTGALTIKSPTGGFQIAQEFLTSEGARAWSTQKVVIYRGDPGFHADEDMSDSDTTAVRGTGSLVGSVDEHGVYTEAAPGATTDFTFNLVRDANGQWRIDGADGLMMSESSFERTYRATCLYFPTPDRSWFVPDERWFPARNWQTYAVRETLVGPSPWLAASVTTVAPEGTALAIEAVPVEETGPIQVELNSIAAQASRADRVLLAQQLEAVLSDTTHRTVELLAGAQLLNSRESRPQAPAVATQVGDPVVVSGDQLVRLTGGKPQQIEGLVPLAGLNPTAFAFGVTGPASRFVVRDGASRIVSAPTSQVPSVTLFEGRNVLAPSVDRFGQVWTGTQFHEGSLQVVTQDNTVVSVLAPWLAGRTIDSVRVAPDGTRIAVVSDGAAGVRVDVAGIIRTNNGLPTELSDPLRVGRPLVDVTQAVWVDRARLGVLGRSAADAEALVYLVPVAGPTERTSPVTGAVSIAAGGTPASLLLNTSDATLWSYGSASLWTKVTTEVRLPTYAG